MNFSYYYEVRNADGKPRLSTVFKGAAELFLKRLWQSREWPEGKKPYMAMVGR